MNETGICLQLFAEKIENPVRDPRDRSNSMVKTRIHTHSFIFLTFRANTTRKRLFRVGFIDFFHENS